MSSYDKQFKDDLADNAAWKTQCNGSKVLK